MKLNFFKYIFIVFIIGIMIFAIVKIKGQENTKEQFQNKVEEQDDEIKEINLGVALFDSINPLLSSNKNIQDVSKLIFDSLMTLNPEYKLENNLVNEWAKQNGNEYILKLKDGIKWSDGSDFSAQDVKFTVDRLKDSESIYKANVENVVGIEILDKNTIKIILDREVPFFEYNLTFPILSNEFYENREFSADIVPIGTGKYKVIDVKESSLLLGKNEYYKEYEKLKIEKININTYATVGELYNAFKIGSIDMVQTQNSNLKEYIGTIGYRSKEIKGREHDFIVFNTQNQVLLNENVRKAISYSIDKGNIVSAIYGNNYYVSSFPLDYGSWAYKEQDSSLGYNLEQAKQILVDDGWDYKYKYWQKNVDYKFLKISLNFVVKASDELKVLVAENIKAQLENQGIRINLIKASDTQYQNYLSNKNYDMILCSINLSIKPDLTMFFGENNLANYNTDEVKELMNEILNTNNDEKIINNYKRLGEIYKNDIPYISLYNNRYVAAYNDEVKGVENCNWFYQYYNIENWCK